MDSTKLNSLIMSNFLSKTKGEYIMIKNNQLIKQLTRFAIVGVIAAVVDIGVLILLKEFLHIDVLISCAVSFCASVIVNYILSMTFVFRGKKQNKLNEFLIFVLLSVGGLLLNEIILWVGTEYLSIYYLKVKILAMIAVPVYNFVTRKIFLEERECV